MILLLYDKISLRKFFSGDNEYPRGSKNMIMISLSLRKNSSSRSSDVRYVVVAKTSGLPVSRLRAQVRGANIQIELSFS